jgi:hypothetical protein
MGDKGNHPSSHSDWSIFLMCLWARAVCEPTRVLECSPSKATSMWPTHGGSIFLPPEVTCQGPCPVIFLSLWVDHWVCVLWPMTTIVIPGCMLHKWASLHPTVPLNAHNT